MMHRTGLIIPSSNIVIEDVLQSSRHLNKPDVRYHMARLSVVSVNLGAQSLSQFEHNEMERAVEQLMEADVNEIIFAGTAGAWNGIERERAWCQETSDTLDVPITSTTLIAVDILKKRADANLALITPFTKQVHDKILENFAAENICPTINHHFNLETSRDMASISEYQIADKINESMISGADTILCFCTNFRGMDAFQILQRAPEPIALFDSVALTLERPHGFSGSQ